MEGCGKAVMVASREAAIFFIDREQSGPPSTRARGTLILHRETKRGRDEWWPRGEGHPGGAAHAISNSSARRRPCWDLLFGSPAGCIVVPWPWD